MKKYSQIVLCNYHLYIIVKILQGYFFSNQIIMIIRIHLYLYDIFDQSAKTIIRTCYTRQYLVTKYVVKVHANVEHFHNLLDSILICNRAIPMWKKTCTTHICILRISKTSSISKYKSIYIPVRPKHLWLEFVSSYLPQ